MMGWGRVRVRGVFGRLVWVGLTGRLGGTVCGTGLDGESRVVYGA